MRLPLGIGVVAVGLLVLWLGVTGKLDRFAQAFNVLTHGTPQPTTQPASLSLPPLPDLPSLGIQSTAHGVST